MKEKKQSERKLLRVLLVLTLVIGLVSGMNVMAYADNDPVDYRTATVDGTTHAVTFRDQQCTNYTIVTADTKTFEDGKWYVVNADVTINERITVNGTANLILVDGKTLTAEEGITVSTDKTLNIYGQSSDTGALNAKATCVIYEDVRIIRSAAIGGYVRRKANRDEDEEYDEVGDGQPIFYFPNCGTINIYGGVITANCPGDNSEAGIGGVGEDGQGGNVTVYGGNVTATGGTDGAGIGGGSAGSGGNVTVYGGIIHASGGKDAMGIGKGEGGQDNGNLTVASTHIAYSHTAAITNDNKDTADKMQGTGTESTITRKRYMLVEPGATHSHSFTYTVSGATITATCSADGCTLPPSSAGGTDHVATLTIGGPTLATYGGSGSAEATITDENSIKGEAAVVYKKGDETLTSAPTDAGTYTASITLGEATASVEYTIARADPTANAPTGLTATYGQTLADVSLEGKNPTSNTEGTWAWADAETTSVGNAGNNKFKANYTPTDTANYNSVDGVDVTIAVGKIDATDEMKAATATLKAKSGQTATVSYTLPDGASYGNVTNSNTEFFTVDTSNGLVLTAAKDWTESEWSATMPKTFEVAISNATNYNDYTLTVTVTPTFKNVQTITAADVTTTYGTTDAKVNATTNGDGTLSYAVNSGDAVTVDAATGALTIVKVGTATITVTAAETETYAAATKDVTVTVNKADASPAISDVALPYTGQPQELVTAGTVSGGTLQYALGTDSANAPADGWSTEVPTGTEPGKYYVWYRVLGDENHNGVDAACIVVTIAEPTSQETPAAAPAEPESVSDYTLLASMKTSGDKALKLKWTAVTGAEGYDVFFGRVGKKAELKTSVNGTSCKIGKLKKGKAYRAFVKAWKTENGQKVYIGQASPDVHAVAGGKSNKFTNAKKITVKKKNLTVAVGGSKKIKASLKKFSNSRRYLNHTAKIRYFSSNRAVATVNAKGKVTGVAPGTCTVYAVAENGLRKGVKITVK